MANDISRNALFVLVIIAIVVSILSTSFVMNAVYIQSPGAYSRSASAKASLRVEGNPVDSGKVTLTVAQKKINSGG